VKKVNKESPELSNLSKDIAQSINTSTLRDNEYLSKENKDFRKSIKKLEAVKTRLEGLNYVNSKKTDKTEDSIKLIKQMFFDGRSQGVSWVKEYWERIVILVILGALELFLTEKEAGIAFMKELSEISKAFLPEYFFITTLYIISIIVSLTFFLPSEKLRNAKKGLKEFKINDLGAYITKFEEIHNEIKETEELESEFSKKLSKRAILKKILFSDEIKKIEKNADVIWVTSKDLVFDTDLENIAFVKNNLENGKKYHWFIPKDIDGHLVEKMEENFVDNKGEKLKGYSFHRVERKGWMLAHDVVVYNPGNATKTLEVYEFTFNNGGIIQLSREGSKSLRMTMKAIIDRQ
jgi:hypothetical protein